MSITLQIGPAASPAPGGASLRLLVFRLGTVQYAVELLSVREIIGLTAITPLPHAPAWMRGVMNLRGRITPVQDLRTKFGLAPEEATRDSCIIVMEGGAGVPGGVPVMGVIVDGVRDVLEIPREAVEPVPELGCGTPLPGVRGLAKVQDGALVLLDVDVLLGLPDAAAGGTP